jgi:hypothetical protein
MREETLMAEGHSPESPGAAGSGPTGEGDQVFEVRVTGNVPDDVLEDLALADVSARELRTSLRAHFRDQSELHGFLARLRTYGLEVVEVRRLTIDPADKPDSDAP